MDTTVAQRQTTAQVPPQTHSRQATLTFVVVGAALLALCVFFHLYRLAQTPGWDAQEGYNLDLAWNLLHGRLRLFALTGDFAQHPPLFYLQVALAVRLLGYNMLAVRAVTALYALLTCGAILLVGRRILGIAPAVWAAAAYTVSPVILANTRWGYSYAQLAFVGLLCLWATWRYMQARGRPAAEAAPLGLGPQSPPVRAGERAGDSSWRWLVIASVLAGVAAFSDYEGVAWVVFVALVVWRVEGRRGWRRACIALTIGAGMLLIGLLACLIAAPGVFVADFGTTLSRAGGGNLVIQALDLLLNYYRLLAYDPWLLLGVVGVFLIPRSRPRGFLLGATALVALVALKVRDIGLNLHTIVPLLPLLALGAGVALDLAVRRLDSWLTHWLAPVAADAGANQGSNRLASLGMRFIVTLIVFVVVVSPVAMATASDAVGLSGSLTTRQDALLAPPADAQAVADYIYAHAHSGDLVLASPALAWMFDSPENAPSLRGADILQTLAQSGQAAAFYPAGLPADRWAYPVTLDVARYIIVDDLIRQLAAPDQLPALMLLLHHAQRWPTVYTRGQYTVYERPIAAT
ncbi:MAG: glycosyltransferase family 39 protein [Ktedonobacterales bacterium]